MIAKKCQRRQKSQKKPRHLGPLDDSWQERLADVVTPLWRLSHEQLKVKFEAQKKILQRLEFYLQMLNGVNPVINGYRNKSTFSACVEQYCFLPRTTKYSFDSPHWSPAFCFVKEELCVQKETVKNFFTKGPGAVCDLTSLYFQESTTTRCSHQQSPYQLLFGEPHIFEDLLGLKICISPDAFFQVNIAGAEILYRTVGELSGVNSNTVLLDICCVLGIELVEQAVEDARWTAAFNGITNCEFHTGRAEKILPQILKSKEDGQLIVAVVNPARAGTANVFLPLDYQVVQAIRNYGAIRILVFVSCKPHGEITRNIIELCCPPNSAKKFLGEPFVLRQAVPVDLFPHTPHRELVLLFTQ
ncbi:hypothetical protein EI555_004982 [Monodon monoceros]|uniref:tRNA (uracil(54)-C(5))-methyltransferase n=1 Tax=Monodon monoceros TaxID=40151 RepID=A0A4U1EKP6_MONMO|nr:hypothetical protein EI555_004982 [Monodon monoceros]